MDKGGAMPTREVLERSFTALLAQEAAQLHHMVTALEGAVGPVDAAPVVDEALRAYGSWKGRRVAELIGPDVAAPDRLLGLVRGWPFADLYGVVELGWGSVEVADTSLAVDVDTPDVRYLASVGRWDLAEKLWRLGLLGATEEAGTPFVSVTGMEGKGGSLHLVCVHDQELTAAPAGDVAGSTARAATAFEASAETRGAQFLFFARSAIDAFDATGEIAVRDGIRSFGRERGTRVRQSHLEAGKPIDLQTLLEDFDLAGQEAWHRSPGVVSPKLWLQDVTYCPFAKVWRELGGMDLGRIYDMEFHVAEFAAYHPDIRVGWDKLMTRGDSVCTFHFSLPSAEERPSLPPEEVSY